MKILLQDKENSLFFRRLGMWTASFQEAFDFKQARIAMDFVSLYAIENTRILVVSVTAGRRVQMLPFDLPAGAAASARPAIPAVPQPDELHPGILEASLEPAGASLAGHARK